MYIYEILQPCVSITHRTEQTDEHFGELAKMNDGYFNIYSYYTIVKYACFSKENSTRTCVELKNGLTLLLCFCEEYAEVVHTL